jgi:electron transport complex protein RnfG
MSDHTAKPSRQILASAGLLALVAMIGTGLLAGVHQLTRDRIAEQERQVMLRQLAQVLPSGQFDNDPIEDLLKVAGSAFSGQDSPVTIYRARQGDRPVAAVFDHVAPDGYNGDIHLLTGILANGTVSGVRVITHKETPGLGDPIEIERSDWIRSFEGRSLRSPEPARWGVRRDGGAFDQFTGATITPRAVVEAVRRALDYHQSNRQALFEAPAATAQEAAE